MAIRTIRMDEGTEYSGHCSAFTDYEDYVQYKHWFTQTKLYKKKFISDTVHCSWTEISFKTVFLIVWFISSFLFAHWTLMSMEGKETRQHQVLKDEPVGKSLSQDVKQTDSQSTPNQNDTEKSQSVFKPFVVREDEKQVSPKPQNAQNTQASVQQEGQNTPRQRIIALFPRPEPVGILIHPLFERELQTLFDQVYIDPLTEYILKYQGDKNRARYIERAKIERTNRCAEIEKKFLQRGKNCKHLAWLKRGYNFSCPEVVVRFGRNLSC
jgi:hypothetical protein